MEPLDGPVSLPSALVTPSPDTMLDMDAFNLPTPDSSDLLAIQPQSSAAKPPKKRKSWGQPLPEPTTSLGPRKRAKTADEKEQRRIERIKRNRAAAHNSRERKRQEAAQLEIENGRLKQQMAILHAALAKCREYVPAALLPQLTADAFAAAQVSFQQDIKEESLVDTPASYATIDPRASLTASTPNESTSPPYIKAEAASPSPMTAPSASAATFTSELPLDQTRHSAAMLCDLQCRSSESTLEDKAASWRWAQLILYLMCLNITICYKSILVASWMQWPSRMERMMAQLTSTSTPSSATTTSTRQTTTIPRTTNTSSSTTTTRPRPVKASTSTTPFSLPTLLSLGPSWPTTAHSLATCPKPVAISAASLALLSKVMEAEKTVSKGLVAPDILSSDVDPVIDDHGNQMCRRLRRSGDNFEVVAAAADNDDGDVEQGAADAAHRRKVHTGIGKIHGQQDH